MKTLIIVDFYNYLYRAYYAIRPLTSPSGQPVNAVYGFTKMLLGIKKDYPFAEFVVVGEGGGQTERKKIYAEYKATRSKMPDDLRSQIEPLKKIIALLDIPFLFVPNEEADDVIASLALQTTIPQVLIASGDKDLMQLVGDKIKILDTMKQKTFDRLAVIEKFGVEPHQILDYLTLLGDASDNIPGARGIGEKTAQKLIQEYKDIASLLAAENLNSKIKEKLEASIDNIHLSYQLLQLRTNLPHGYNDNHLAFIKKTELNEYLSELGMKSLVGQF